MGGDGDGDGDGSIESISPTNRGWNPVEPQRWNQDPDPGNCRYWDRDWDQCCYWDGARGQESKDVMMTPVPEQEMTTLEIED